METEPTKGWWTVFAGAIVEPIIVFVIPFFINMRNYKKIVKDNKGQDLEVTMELLSDKIVLRNSMTQNQISKYENVKDITDKGGMLVVMLKSGESLYFGSADENFIGCSKQEFLDRLSRKSDKKVFDV